MEEFEENGNETTAKASNGLSYQGLSRLASGAPAPETPAAGDTPATPKRDAYLDFLDNLQAKQKYARGVELDRDLYEFYNSGDAKDEEKAFAFYDKWTQDRFGVGTTRGDIWTRDRKGFDNAQQYGNALFGLSQRGYAAIASPEYKAWEKACAAGDRAEMMRLAGIDPTVTEREGEAPAYTVGAAGAIVDNRPLVSRQKTDEEIDEELDAHNAKMKSENWLGAFRAMDAAYHFTDEEKELVRASLRSGDGLPKEYEDTYAGIIRGDVSRAAVLNYLIDNGRHVESRWLRDNVVLPFTSVVKSFWQGAKDTFEEASLSRAYTRANYETVRSSSDSAKFYWNDEERAEYKRLLDSGELAREAEARHYANADLAEIAKERVDAQCARRLADEAKPREQYLRERRERLYLEDALSPKAAGDYGWFSRSVSGAISTLPYMAMSATPAGFAWNVAAQFQDVRNDLILRGEDPDKALFFQAFSATAWAAIEKVQWGGLFGKELSNLAKKRLLGNVLQKAWGAGKLQGIGTLLKEGGKDVLKKTVKESLEEGMQGGLEGWTREYLRSADLSKAMDAAVGQAASDFVDSLGAMGLVSLASTGAKFSGARHAAVGIDDLVEVAQAKIHALNTYKNTLFDPEKGAPDAQLNKQTAAFAADCQSIMDAHVKDGSGAIAAMDEIAAKYALAPKESQVIAEWLDLRQNAIGMAKWANSDAAANFAARELGVLPIGNDTTFDVEGLFRLVNPNARVERVQVADTAAPAPKTVRHVNADEVDALEAQLAGMKARLDEMPQNAKKRKAERQYAERAKRLARLKNRLAEEEQTAQDAVPTKDVVRVTIPMGDKGETKSFVVETSSAAPDIESRGFAASVSEAMRGAIGEDGVVDGGTLTDEQFAALPIAQKANVAVTENQYLAMSEEDKAAYLEMNSLKEGGDFRILDGEGKVVYNADALVTLKRALNAPSPFTRVGGNSTLAHEYSHAISRFARDLGLVSGEDAKTMSALFGAPRKGVDELWDEEAVGDGFVDFLRGKYDFRRLTEEERRAAMGFFERIWDAIKSVFRLNGMSAPVTQHDRNRREQARETAFEAIQRGDFTGLSQYAGIKFDDDASAPEKKETAKTEEKPQEAKAEEKKTPEETPPPQKEAKPEEMSEEKPARETDASVDADRLQEGLDKVSSSPREAEASTPRRVDLKRTIFTPDYSMKVETETLWAPLADLVESTDDRTVQMRDRSRVATDMQVLEKTRKGTFQPLALFPGTKSDDGAPIVGGGLRIVSGHGRKRMLETLAREGRYSEYLDAINEECRKQGIPASPAGMKNPVLVSRITGGLKNHADLARFAERSNRWGGLERSGAEYAESDARAITPALMRLYAPDANGNLLAASNREFMGAFLDAVGATGLTNADGTPTPEAALRVRRALMTALFGDDERVRSMVRNLLEKGDELSTGTLLNALMKSAGRLLALKDGRASYDIVPDVREAALQYIAWRVEARRNPRLTLSDHLAQTDLFSASATPVQQALARLLENGRFGAAIDRYAELAAKQAVDAQTALPGFAPATPLQLLSRAERDTTPKNPDGSPVAPYVTPDPESEQAKNPVQPMDAGDAGQDRPARAPGGSGGRAGGEPTAGERALARAVIADDIARHSVSRLYTGSAADYDQPSLRAVGTGVGRQAFGWGLYASKNRAVAENHATREQDRKSMPGEAGANAHVYEQTWFTDRPEGDESRLLEWNEVISAETLVRIEKQSDAEGIGQEVRDALRFGNGYEGDNVYDDLRDQVFAGDAKATSEFLARAGIDGMKYPAAPRGWNYISFRDDNMRIDHHWVDGEQRFSVQRVTPEAIYEKGVAKSKNGRYDPRAVLTRVRGGWTKEKILKEVKRGSLFGEDIALKLIAEFDTLDEFKAHMYWHGTGNWLRAKGLVPSVAKGKTWAELNGGGGYGKTYWGISVAKTKRAASTFGDHRNGDTTIYPMVVARNANIVDRPDYADAADVEKDIEKLWNEGVDAVRIGDWDQYSEKELLVLNPNILCNIGNGDYYKYYRLNTDKNPLRTKTDEQLQTLFDYAKSYTGAETEEALRRRNEITRFSVQRVTPEEDAAYMDAVRRGDMETAQRMVCEAAKRAMPNTQVVGEDGLPRIVYHATDEDFTRFDRQKLGTATEANSGNVDMAKIGFWFNDNDLSGKVATNPAKTKAVFLDLENPARATFDELWDGARDEDADGYIVEDTELGGMSYVALDPAQIKSAEPVTYDDAGRVIPLSERFDPADPDIRHSVRRDPWHSVQYGYAQAAGYSEDAHLSPEDKQATDYALDALIEKHHSGSERFGNDVMLANMYPPNWAEHPVVKFALQFVGNDGALRDIRKAFFLRNGWRTNDKKGWLRYNAPAKAVVLEKDYSPKELQEKKNRFQALLDAEREVAKKRSALQKKLGYPAYKDSEEWSRLSAEEQRLKAERLSPDKKHADAEADYQKSKAEWERSKDAKYEEWRNERVARGNAMLDEVARKHGKKTLGEFIAEGRTQPERHSVRRGRREDAVPALDIATGYLARRLLGGKTITPQQAKDILGNLGFVQENPAEVLRRAQSAADTVRERVKDAGERADSELYRYLSQASMAGRMQEAMDRAITGAAQAADPEIGRRLERAISSKRTRDLEAANGFTAAEMMAELPISLTDAFLSVAEFERTPEEKARLEAERAKRAEEEKTDGKTDDEILAEVDDGEVTDPTPEQVAAFDELMGRARYAEDARKRKEAIDKAARAKAKAEAGEEAQSEDEGNGMDEDAIGGIPLARIRRIAPVFEDQNLFAAFLIEWTAQKIVQKHPELTNNRDLWKSPVAIRELKQTATHILRRLAADILGSPTGSHARNFADHVINELESDATCRTYKAVRRKIAYVYDAIHTDGLRQSRKELMHRLTDGWREKGPDGKYIVHPGIRQLVGAKGRFSSTTEEGKRKIDGRTEMYGRTLLRVLAMSDEELQARDAELREITDINPTATGDAGAKATEEKVREAATERVIIAAYGGLARRLPGEIRDATERILADLQGKRQAFEARREAEKAENDKVKAALVEAMSDTPAPRRTKPKGRAEKYVESFVGNIGLEMRNLIRYCKDGKKRDAAQDVITDTEAALSEATGKYRATKMGHEIAINAALKACYGNAADGVRHLTAEPVPEEVARAVFGQDAAMTPTYGNLLQLYASIVQADYKANAEKHGRLAQLPMIRAALTDADMRFYAFALGWYRDNRAALSDAVEAVTGVPVVSPDPLYVPVRVARPVEGLSADVVAWSPIPRALSLRVPHGWDFDEHANFFRLLDEQAEMHAQTVAYAKLGIRLRDTWASRAVQDAARRNVGSDDMMAVTGHMRDVLAQDAARPEDTRILSAINYARAWIARFAISGNLSSAMSQPASIPVWANIMLGHEAVGFRRLARYMMHVDADAVRDLVQSDGYRARYLMGWTEDVQNAILHPSKSRIMSTIETVYDKGMALSKYADKGASLWIAQGFYRDARDMFIRRGDTDADAKRKAIALTWAAVEASQQTGRSEYLNRLQRGNGAVSKILFQFRTAQLLSNNYLIQAVRDVRAGGDPAAKGRLLRAVAINTIIVPAYLTLVRAAWDAILGEPPPENEDVEVPEQVREFLWNAIDNNTAPLFFVSAIASAGAKPLLGLDTYGASSGMPAVDSTIRIGQHAGRALADASRYIVNLCTADDIADEVTAEKLIADVLRLGRDIAAPVRHAARAYDNYMGD